MVEGGVRMSCPRVLVPLLATALVLVTSPATTTLASPDRPSVALQTTTGGGTAGGGETTGGGGATAGGETTGGGATTAGGAAEGGEAAEGEAEGELPGPEPSPGTTFAPDDYEAPWTWWMGVILTVVTVLGIGGAGLGYWLLVHRAGAARR